MSALPSPAAELARLLSEKAESGLSALPLQWPPLRPLLDRRRCREHAGTLALRPPARPKFGQRRGRQVVRRRHGRARRSRRPHPPELWVRVSERDLGRGPLVSERAPARTGSRERDASRPGAARAKPHGVCSRWADPVIGTPAEAYLRARGITAPLDELSSLRFHPGCYYRATDEAPRETWPALLAAITDVHGNITAVHRTWLARDGSRKAPIEDPRRSLGHQLGSGVRLGLIDDVLTVGEGLETMLSLRSVLPRMPDDRGALGQPPRRLGAALRGQAPLRRPRQRRGRPASGSSVARTLRTSARRGLPFAAGLCGLQCRSAPVRT